MLQGRTDNEEELNDESDVSEKCTKEYTKEFSYNPYIRPTSIDREKRLSDLKNILYDEQAIQLRRRNDGDEYLKNGDDGFVVEDNLESKSKELISLRPVEQKYWSALKNCEDLNEAYKSVLSAAECFVSLANKTLLDSANSEYLIISSTTTTKNSHDFNSFKSRSKMKSSMATTVSVERIANIFQSVKPRPKSKVRKTDSSLTRNMSELEESKKYSKVLEELEQEMELSGKKGSNQEFFSPANELSSKKELRSKQVRRIKVHNNGEKLRSGQTHDSFYEDEKREDSVETDDDSNISNVEKDEEEENNLQVLKDLGFENSPAKEVQEYNEGEEDEDDEAEEEQELATDGEESPVKTNTSLRSREVKVQ